MYIIVPPCNIEASHRAVFICGLHRFVEGQRQSFQSSVSVAGCAVSELERRIESDLAKTESGGSVCGHCK